MSAETFDRLEAALREHVADEIDGALLTGYVVIATGISPGDEPGATRYARWTPIGQPIHADLGLLAYADARIRYQVNEPADD